jgi:ABC-type amino acid transport substrate-binding protein
MKQKLKTCICNVVFVLFLACWLTISANAKPLIITTSATFPPFSFFNAEGKPQGLLVDFSQELLQLRTGLFISSNLHVQSVAELKEILNIFSYAFTIIIEF